MNLELEFIKLNTAFKKFIKISNQSKEKLKKTGSNTF